MAQPLINDIVRGSDQGGNYVEVSASDCDFTDFPTACAAWGGGNRYFWWKNGTQQSQWDGQTKVHISDTSANYTVYVYPNASLNPNNHYSTATSYSNGTKDIYNKKPQVNGCGSSEGIDGSRCMQAYVVTSSPSFNWYIKVNGQWQSQSGANCSHLTSATPDAKSIR